MSPPYNIYIALRSSITQPTPILPDPDSLPDIDSKLAQSEMDNKELRFLGKAFYPNEKAYNPKVILML